MMSQNAQEFLLHPLHFFEVQRDGLRDITNLNIPDKLELQRLEAWIVVIVRSWETGYTAGQLRVTAVVL
jgi:hypothetical protein